MLQLSPCAHGWQSSWHRASRGALQEQQHKPHCSSLREHTLTCHIYKPPSSRSLLSSGTLSQNLTTEGQGVRGEYLLSSTGLKVVVAAPCQEERAVSGMIPALPSHPRACFALPPAATLQTQQQDRTGRGPTDAPAHPTSPTALHPAQLPCFPASPCRPHTCTSCFSLGTGCGITFSSPWTNQPNMLPSRTPPSDPTLLPPHPHQNCHSPYLPLSPARDRGRRVVFPGSGCPSATAGSTTPGMLSLGFTRVLVPFAPAQVWSQRARGQAVQASP